MNTFSNIANARIKVHHIRAEIRKLEVAIDDRHEQIDRDLREHQLLNIKLEQAEEAVRLEKIIAMCNTPVWRFRVA